MELHEVLLIAFAIAVIAGDALIRLWLVPGRRDSSIEEFLAMLAPIEAAMVFPRTHSAGMPRSRMLSRKSREFSRRHAI